MEAPAEQRDRLPQHRQEPYSVLVIPEDLASLVSAGGHMEDGSGKVEAKGATHILSIL